MHARPTKIAVAPLVVMRVDEDEIKDALDDAKDAKKAERTARRSARTEPEEGAPAAADEDVEVVISPFRARLNVGQIAERGKKPRSAPRN